MGEGKERALKEGERKQHSMCTYLGILLVPRSPFTPSFLLRPFKGTTLSSITASLTAP